MSADTARFRLLLQRFYDGSATLAEEKELTEAAANADITAPAYADLRADIALLRDLSTSAADARTFANTIDRITGTSTVHTGRFRRKWIIAACSAAAACVALAVTFAAMNNVATPPELPVRPHTAKQVAQARPAGTSVTPTAVATQPPCDTTPHKSIAKAATVPASAPTPAPEYTHTAATTKPDKGGLTASPKAAVIPNDGQELEIAAETVGKSIILLTDNIAATQQSLILTQEILTKVGNNLKHILS